MKRTVKSLTALPTLVTLGNTFCGFLAVTYVLEATHALTPYPGVEAAPEASRALFYDNMLKAVYAMFAAMFFDFMDGKVARLTRSESDFGVQIDSLSDVLSFGLVPAVLFKALYEFEFDKAGKLSLILGIFYLVGAVLRLARFNVEADIENDDHRSFRGLPSPAAAATVASIVFLYCSREWTQWDDVVRIILPWVTAGAGILMWTKLPYLHIINLALTERRNFAHFFLLIVAMAAIFFQPAVGVSVLMLGYVVSGPLIYVWDLFRGKDTVEGESLI